MHVTTTSEKQNQTEQPEATAPSKKSSRKSILALSVLALGINSTAAVYTMSPADFALPNISDFALPDISRLAELLPLQKASDPVLDPAVTLKDIQSAQQQHVAALQQNNLLLQQNSALLHQDSIALASLRQSVVDEQAGVKKISTQIADEHDDVKKISAKISVLIAKVELAAEFNSSGSNFLDFSKARSKPPIPGNAQKDGSAADPCGTCFAWRSPPKSPGYHAFSPPRLKNKARGAGLRSRISTLQPLDQPRRISAHHHVRFDIRHNQRPGHQLHLVANRRRSGTTALLMPKKQLAPVRTPPPKVTPAVTCERAPSTQS